MSSVPVYSVPIPHGSGLYEASAAPWRTSAWHCFDTARCLQVTKNFTFSNDWPREGDIVRVAHLVELTGNLNHDFEPGSATWTLYRLIVVLRGSARRKTSRQYVVLVLPLVWTAVLLCHGCGGVRRGFCRLQLRSAGVLRALLRCRSAPGDRVGILRYTAVH